MSERGDRLIPESKVEEFESRLRAAIGRALDLQRHEVARRLERHGVHVPGLTAAVTGRPPIGGVSVPNAWSSSEWSDNVEAEVTPVAKSIAQEAMDLALAAAPYVVAWGILTRIDETAARVSSVARASGDAIGNRFNEATSNAVQLAAGADAVLTTAGDILDNVVGSLGLAIANEATANVAGVAASSPSVVGGTKVWNAIGDDRTRPDHLDADGQEVALDDTFLVGGEDLLYPGDPAGSDEEIINCRCWLTTTGLT